MWEHYYMRVVTVLLIVGTPLLAVDEIKADKAEAPRLAGDSLPIKADSTTEKEDHEATTVGEAFSKGKVKGLIRYSGQNRDNAYHVLQDAPGTAHSKVQSYSALGGYLGYETAALYNLSIGATFYTSNPVFGGNTYQRSGLGGLAEPVNEDQAAYHVLGEAYLKYDDGENLLKIGRQEMPNYRFVSLSDIRMSPFTHEGVIYENTSIEGLQINLAYITRQKDRNAVEFKDMVRAARVQIGSAANPNIRGSYDASNFDANGKYAGPDKAMSMLGGLYGQDNWKVEAWDFYVNDFVNTVYLYGQYNIDIIDTWTTSLAGQYVSQKDVGSRVAGNVDTWFYGFKAQASSSNGMVFFAAYNEVAYNENSYDGGTLFVRWGTPQMFNSFQVQDSELAGTKSIGVGAQFDLGALGLLDSTVIRFRYADYNMPDNITQRDAAQDRTEATFDLRYSFARTQGFGIFTKLDGLSVQFRMAYDDFRTDYDFKAYEDVHGYSIEKVTKGFLDTRLYVEYRF